LKAKNDKNDKDTLLLLQIERQLTALLTEYLSKFEPLPYNSESFRFFGEIIYKEKPTVLTFNYDTLLESTIESASMCNHNVPTSYLRKPLTTGEVPNEELPYSHFTWNRPLAYGIKFDEVQLKRAGLPPIVSGQRFYSHPDNNLYDSPLLKLHGSINWFRYTGINKNIFRENETEENKLGKTGVLNRVSRNWWINEPSAINGEIIQPIIITPVLYKDLSQDSIIYEIWERAYKELSTCKRLIVGGYSFPPTDFNTKRLFLEAFSEHSVEEIIVINPITSVVQIVKDLCHFNRTFAY
jgi:hypothetical protein